MILSTVALLALVVICAWTFGGIALRFAGALVALAGLLGLSMSGDAIGFLVFGLGAIAWFAGSFTSGCATGSSRARSPNGLPPIRLGARRIRDPA